MSKTTISTVTITVSIIICLIAVLGVRKIPTFQHFIGNNISSLEPIHKKELNPDRSLNPSEEIHKDIIVSTKGGSGTQWNLVWQDEFSGDTVDETKWNLVDLATDSNNELQHYRPENVSVENGCLKILSNKENFKGRKFTSGALETKGKVNIQYGKIEIKARLPKGQGIFPAFWMLPEKNGDFLPEIDIMEMIGDNPNEIWAVYHWKDNNGKQRKVYSSYKGPDFSQDFHIFSLEWESEHLTWSVDGQEILKTKKAIPSEPSYLYLNTAIGGDWPGSPNSSTTFPQILNVDYVRVYVKAD